MAVTKTDIMYRGSPVYIREGCDDNEVITVDGIRMAVGREYFNREKGDGRDDGFTWFCCIFPPDGIGEDIECLNSRAGVIFDTQDQAMQNAKAVVERWIEQGQQPPLKRSGGLRETVSPVD